MALSLTHDTVITLGSITFDLFLITFIFIYYKLLKICYYFLSLSLQATCAWSPEVEIWVVSVPLSTAKDIPVLSILCTLRTLKAMSSLPVWPMSSSLARVTSPTLVCLRARVWNWALLKNVTSVWPPRSKLVFTLNKRFKFTFYTRMKKYT